MTTLSSHVRAEADAIDLELVGDHDRPALPVQDTDTLLGVLDDDLRKLFVLQKRWRLQFEAGLATMSSIERTAREHQINELVIYFWSEVVATYGLQGLGGVFIRQNWEVVLMQSPDLYRVQRIAQLMQENLSQRGTVVIVL